jgi:hypothetical protein
MSRKASLIFSIFHTTFLLHPVNILHQAEAYVKYWNKIKKMDNGYVAPPREDSFPGSAGRDNYRSNIAIFYCSKL